MSYQLQVRRDTAAAWTSANPILADGEIGYEKDTGKFKFGDGTTAWGSLSYFEIGSGISGVSSFNSRTGTVNPAVNDYTWADIDKTTSDIADITTKSHTSLTDIGTNTHSQIDSHIADSGIHIDWTNATQNLITSGDITGGVATFDQIFVNGDVLQVDSQITTADNVIDMNAGEVNAGVTAGFSGLRVDRGTANNYWLGFDEVRDAFSIGVISALDAANIATTQLVATREDAPAASGIMYWDNANNRLITGSATLDSMGNLTAATIDTGQGATEVYPMDQAVRSTDNVEFNVLTTNRFYQFVGRDAGDGSGFKSIESWINDTNAGRFWMAPQTDGSTDYSSEFGYDWNSSQWYAETDFDIGGKVKVFNGIDINGSSFVDASRNITAGTGDFSGDVVLSGAGVKLLDIISTNSSAGIRISRKAITDRANIILQTDSVSKWYIGLGDSDISGYSGDELYIARTDGGPNPAIAIDVDGNVGIGTPSPATILDINGAFTFHEKNADPTDPVEGSAVLWMSDGTGSGDDGDVLLKITAGGVTKTATIADFSIL